MTGLASSTIQSWASAYLLNSVWQVPLVFVAAWIVARLARRVGPRLEHRVWVTALLLETVLPGCDVHPGDLWHRLSSLIPWSIGGAAHGQVRVLIGPGIASGSGALRLPAALFHALLLAYACGLLYFAGRLAWGLWSTAQIRRQAQPVTLTGDAAASWAQCVRHYGGHDRVRDAASVAVSSGIVGPVTIGVHRCMVLLPPQFLETVAAHDLHAVFAHEFAHIRRHDFAKNLLYGILSLPVAWHPMLWLTRSRVTESREMVCDAIAARAVQGRQSYARSLLRLASMLSLGTPARTLHAVGIFDANIFERRVMNLTRRPKPIVGVRRTLITAACGLVALATCASALEFRMNVGAPIAAAQSERPARITVKNDDLKIISRQPPVYPPAARKDKVQGSVILAVTIGKDGVPGNIKIEKSVRADLDKSARDAVRQWRWQPYLLNGNPIDVDTTLTITYNLGG